MLLESDRETIDDAAGTGGPMRALPSIIAQIQDQKNRIVANWALRVASMPAFRAMPSLPLDEVQRHIPQVLDGALTAIATSDPTLDPLPLARATELAAAHGRARLLDDFSVGDVLAEFSALRREVWAALWRVVENDREAVSLLRELELRLTETFDAIAIAAAEAWVATRESGSGS